MEPVQTLCVDITVLFCRVLTRGWNAQTFEIVLHGMLGYRSQLMRHICFVATVINSRPVRIRAVNAVFLPALDGPLELGE